MPQAFKVYEAEYPYFITSTIVHWISVFSRQDYFRVLTDSLNYCIQNKGLIVHAYVLMPNHFHLICSALAGLSAVMRDMKKHTSKLLAQKLDTDGRQLWLSAMERAAGNTSQVRIWDEAFHPEQINSERFFQQKLDYLHNNPVRAGYVLHPYDWLHSSAGYYYRGQEPTVALAPLEW